MSQRFMQLRQITGIGSSEFRFNDAVATKKNFRVMLARPRRQVDSLVFRFLARIYEGSVEIDGTTNRVHQPLNVGYIDSLRARH